MLSLRSDILTTLRQRSISLLGLMLLCSVSLSVVVTAAMPEAGTLIENQASVSYIDSTDGTENSITSNISTFRVAAVPALTLESDQAIFARPATTFNVAHVLTNTGNSIDSYTLNLANVTGDDFQLSNLGVYLDANNNGLRDAGEVALTVTPPVMPGEQLNLVISGQSAAPPIADGAQAQLTLTAVSSLNTAISVTNTDSVTIASNAVFRLTKTNSPECATPAATGSDIQYTLSATNASTLIAEPRDFAIGGEVMSGFVLADVIPANTSLLPEQTFEFSPATSIPVVQVADKLGTAEWLPYSDWDGTTTVAQIGLFLQANALAPAQEGRFSFPLRVNDFVTQGTRILNTATMDLDNDSVADFTTEEVCNELLAEDNEGNPVAAQIRFLEPSNALQVAGTPPNFSNDSNFNDVGVYRLDSSPNYNLINNGVYIEVRSTSLNTLSYAPDGQTRAIRVTLSSLKTEDSLTVLMLETSPNSGIFRSLRPIALSETTAGNCAICTTENLVPDYTSPTAEQACTLLSTNNDNLRIQILDPGTEELLLDAAVVDPLGVVFDAVTGEPISGAIVSIIDLATGERARNPDTGGETLLEPQITGIDGRYQYPRVFPGSYYLDIEAPEGFAAPSRIAIDDLPGEFNVSEASYGRNGFEGNIADAGVFTLQEGDPPLVVDIPMDATQLPGEKDGPKLVLDKSILVGSERLSFYEIDLGDRIKYVINVRNVGDLPTVNTRVIDTPPFGYRFEQGTAKASGQSITPERNSQSQLVFHLDELPPGSDIEISYILKATAGAVDSDGLNTAFAVGTNAQNDAQVRSETANARLKLKREGLLSDRTILFGKVFIDATCDGIQARGEWPIGGVRIYLEDGTYVVTDENGQYSLYGVKPGQHVLKVDPLTVPAGIRPMPTQTRHGADPESRFVDVIPYEFHRADFVYECPGIIANVVYEELKKRNQSIKGDWLFEDAIQYNGSLNRDRGRFTPQRVTPSYDGDISSSTVGRREAKIISRQPTAELKSTVPSGQVKDPVVGSAIESGNAFDEPPVIPVSDIQSDGSYEAHTLAMPDTAKAAESVTVDMAKKGTWLWPESNVSFGGRFMVAVRAGVKATLMLNGKPVSADRLGEHVVHKKNKAQILAWYGLPIVEGDNELKVVAKDMFGNERVLAEQVFYHPGKAVSLELSPRKNSLPADGGRSHTEIDLYLKDSNGRAVAGVHFITLETERGRWREKDVQDRVPGYQLKIVNGKGIATLRSSDFTGSVLIRGTVNEFIDETTINFLPALRPMVAAGLIDIGAQFSQLKSQGIEPTDQKEGFDDKLTLNGRAALFLKGKVRGDALLTLSYDTAKDSDDEQFRDIDPEAYYPIYGDASVKGYDAQSQSKLYVKLEKNKNSVLWGDYQTDSQSTLRNSLVRVNEVLTGANVNYESESGSKLNAYVAESDNNFEIETLPGRGIASGYQLNPSRVPIASNSEQIFLVTLDRESTDDASGNGLVIEERQLERFKDYNLNTLTGIINFTEPVPTFDRRGNPIFIRVTYQSRNNPDSHVVMGLRGAQKVNDNLTFGVSLSQDDDDEEGYLMGGLFADFSVNDKHALTAEIATRSNKAEEQGSGQAAQLQWQATWSDRVKTDLRIAKADENFTNRVSPISAGREEARLRADVLLNDKQSLNVDGLHSKNTQSQNTSQRDAVSVSFNQRIGRWNVAAGAKHTKQQNAANSDSYQSLITAVDRNFNYKEKAGRVFLDAERGLGSEGRSRIEVGSEYQLHQKVSVYGRHEIIDSINNISSLNGDEQRSNTSIGLKTDFLPSTELYSEYRMRGANNGRELQAVNGMRGRWEVKPNINLSPSLEVINTLEGDNAQDVISTSVTVTDTRNDNVRRSLRVEGRFADFSDTYALDYRYAGRINQNWTSLFLNRLSLTKRDGEEDQLRNTFSAAFAHRPRLDNRWHSLYLAQWREERNITEQERSVYLLSTHQNYQFSQDVILSGRFAAKWQDQLIDEFNFNSTAQLLGGRLTWALTRRWDADIRLGLLTTDLGEDQRFSAGIGAHYLIKKNLRLGAGFNFVGFEDQDLDEQKYHAEGLFFGLQYKFDEDAFSWLR